MLHYLIGLEMCLPLVISSFVICQGQQGLILLGPQGSMFTVTWSPALCYAH